MDQYQLEDQENQDKKYDGMGDYGEGGGYDDVLI